MRIDFEVEDKHIKSGKRGKTCECPIALALIDRLNLPFNMDVVVGHAVVRLIYNNRNYVAETTVKAFRFIKQFDRYEEVKPQKFRLDFKPDERR